MISVYIVNGNGQYTKLTEVRDITGETLSPSTMAPYDAVRVCEPFTATYTFSMSRKGLRVFAKMMGMPKYKITEWACPKKKKRGTMRRRKFTHKKEEENAGI